MSYHNVFPVNAAMPDLSIERLTADKIKYSTIPQDLLFNPAQFDVSGISLRGSVKDVYLYFLSLWNYERRDVDASQWVIIKTAISKATGWSLCTIDRALAKLKKMGLADWKRNSNGSTEWEFLLPETLGKSAYQQKAQEHSSHEPNNALYNINTSTDDKKSNNGAVVFFEESLEKVEGAESVENIIEERIIVEQIPVAQVEIRLPAEVEKLPKGIQKEIKNSVSHESAEIQALVLSHLAKALLSKTSPVQNPVGLVKSFVTKAKDGALSALFVPSVIDDKESEIKQREANLNALRVRFNNLRNNLSNLRNLNALSKSPAIEAQIEKAKQDLKAFVLENPDVGGFA